MPSRPAPLRLLVDARTALSAGGAKLLLEIAPRLAAQSNEQQHVGLLCGPEDLVGPDAGALEIIRTTVTATTWFDRWKWYRSALPKAAEDWQADAVYSMSGFAPRALVRQIPTVATVNNMMPFSPEIQHELYRGDPKALIRYRILKSQYIRGMVNADQVVLHSQHALDTIGQHVAGLGGKTHVVHTGIPRELTPDRTGSHPFGGDPYLLFLSAFRRYKNHLRLVEAYGQAASTRPLLPNLKLAGFPADKEYLREIRELVSASGLDDRVEILEAVDSHAIPPLMQFAELHLLPTRCETNCVVAAEVMGVGGALVCSDIAPLREAALDSAHYFDPESVSSIRDAIVGLWDTPDEISRLRSAALKRSRDFSWDACAEAIWTAAHTAARRR